MEGIDFSDSPREKTEPTTEHDFSDSPRELPEKKNSISEPSSPDVNPSASEIPSSSKIKEQNVKQMQLNNTKLIKDRMRTAFEKNDSPVFKQVFIDTLSNKGYDKKKLEDYAQEIKFDAISKAQREQGKKDIQNLIDETQNPSLVDKLANNAVEGLEQGATQMSKGLQGLSDKIGIQGYLSNKPLTTKLGEAGTDALNAIAGATKAGFAVAGAMSPELLVFNAATEKIHDLPDEVKQGAVELIAPSYGLKSKEEQAQLFDKTVDFPFAAASTIAESMGYNPEEGSAGRATLDILNVLVPLGAHYANEAHGTKTKIKDAKDLTDLAEKIKEGKATEQESKDYVAVSDAMKNISPEEVKHEMGTFKKETPNTSDETHTKVAELQGIIESPEFKQMPAEMQQQVVEDHKIAVDDLAKQEIDSTVSHVDEAHNAAEISSIKEKINNMQGIADNTQGASKESALKVIDNLKQQLNEKEAGQKTASISKYEINWKDPEDWELNQETDGYSVGSTKNFNIESLPGKMLFNFKDDARQKNQLKELNDPITVNLEDNNFNRVHIGGISKSNLNKGFGKEIYHALIEKNDIISTSEGASSSDAQRVWNSLIKSGEYYWGKVGHLMAVAKNKSLIEKFINSAKEKFIKEPEIEQGEPILNNNIKQSKSETNAVQEQSPSSVVQHAQETISEPGSISGGMEQGEQGVEASNEGKTKEEISEQIKLTPEQESEINELKPIGNGKFGSIYTQLKGKAKQAIKLLLRKKEGDAIGALSHPDIGDIDLVWGEEGTGNSDGYGLSKIAKFHPEVINNLQNILNEMKVESKSNNRINLESEDHKASIRLDWDGDKKTWLLTAYEKEIPIPIDKSTVVAKSPEKEGNAIPTTDIGNNKDTTNNKSSQEAVSKEIGITHAKINEARAERDLLPLEKEASVGNEERWEKVKSEIEKGDRTPQSLAQNIIDNPRPISADEVAELDYDRISLENQRDELMNKLEKQQEDAKTEESAITQLDLDAVNEKIDSNDRASWLSGSETGKGLQMRQRLFQKDYSMTSMERKLKADKGGKPLTEKEKSDIKEIHEQMKSLDAREKKLQQEREEFEANKIKQSGQNIIDETVKKNTSRFKLTEEEKAERKRLKNKFVGRFNDFTSMATLLVNKEFLKYGKLLAKEAAFDFTEFSKKAIQELGEKVKPILKDWFDKSNNEGVEKEFEPALSEEGKIKGINSLMKKFVKEGVNDFDEMVKKVHETFPELEKSEIEKQISEYGKKRLPSKDEIQKQIRELKAEGKLKLGLKDVLENNKLPERSGIIRDKASEKILKLRDDLRKAILENSPKFDELSETEKEKRFKSALDTYKSRSKKLISEYEKKLANNEFEVKPRKLLELDEEAEKIKIEKERIKRKFDVQREEARQENTGLLENIARGAAKLERFNIFLSLKGMIKLSVAAAMRPLFKPATEIAKYTLSNLPGTKEVMKKSPSLYTPDIKTGYESLKDYYKTLLSKSTAKEAAREFNKGSDWNLMHTKEHSHSRTLLGKILDKPQQAHGFLKTFPKISEYESSYNKALKNLAAEGMDISEPSTKKLAEKYAENDALASVFMGDNEVSSLFKQGINRGQKSKNAIIQGMSIIAEQSMPVLKVPANFYHELFQNMPLGGALDAMQIIHRAGEQSKMNKGGYEGRFSKLKNAFSSQKQTEGYRGIKNLTPEQAARASRALTNQLLGAMALATGVALYKKFGDDGIKKLEENEYYLHVPFAKMVTNGAKIAKESDEEKGVIKASKDVLDESAVEEFKALPQAKAAVELVRATAKNADIGKKAAEMMTTLLVPSVASAIAREIDNERKTDPQDVLEVFMDKIPGLRKLVAPEGTTAYKKKLEKEIYDTTDKGRYEKSLRESKAEQKKSENKLKEMKVKRYLRENK